jgi:DNA replication and repair protein RecF
MADTLTHSVTDKQGAHALASIGRLQLHQFRNYATLDMAVDDMPIVLFGDNGAGKTNILEALSLLSQGRGMRGARLRDLDHVSADGASRPWSVAVTINDAFGPSIWGTGRDVAYETDKRLLRHNGASAKFAQLAGQLSVVWLTPAIEQLFLAGSSERRAYVDRLSGHFFPEHARSLYRYEHAVRERNKLLLQSCRDAAWYDAVEANIAEWAVVIAMGRNDTLERLNQSMAMADDRFPSARVWMDGMVEQWVRELSASDAEKTCREALQQAREKDKESGRTSVGVHKSDLQALHAAKKQAARLCSTGEQKAIMLSLTMGFVRARAAWGEQSLILLLDEVVAHLDAKRREALYQEIQSLKVQAWMTGTEAQTFQSTHGKMQGFEVKQGVVKRIW